MLKFKMRVDVLQLVIFRGSGNYHLFSPAEINLSKKLKNFDS